MRARQGFSFAEVMFAVVILGVGFIMVASVFPVAAEQTRANIDQSVGAQIARDAVSEIRVVTTNEDYDDISGHVIPFSSKKLQLWDKVASSMICRTDRRYACVPFYSRTSMQQPICLTVLVVRRWIHDSYTVLDEDSDKGELVPKNLRFGIRRLGDGTNVVDFDTQENANSNAVTSGAYLIVTSADSQTAGHVLQIGSLVGQTADAESWSLAPTCNLVDESCSDGSYGMIVGRDFIDTSNSDSGFAGPAQDVSVFKTFLSGD